jgi:hypothetical protein
MGNPYRMVENWPALSPGMKWGAAINFLPDNQGGTWALLRTEPPIVYFTASGTLSKQFGAGMFVSGHGMCRDRDGNIWAGDSGPFRDSPESAGRGFQVFKFSPDGHVLLTLGKAGVSRAGEDTAIGRGPLTRSKMEIGLCALQPPANSSPRTESWDAGQASSWGLMRWLSISRAACSWPIVRTIESRFSTRT